MMKGRGRRRRQSKSLIKRPDVLQYREEVNSQQFLLLFPEHPRTPTRETTDTTSHPPGLLLIPGETIPFFEFCPNPLFIQAE
jgi:hypothetical protein